MLLQETATSYIRLPDRVASTLCEYRLKKCYQYVEHTVDHGRCDWLFSGGRQRHDRRENRSPFDFEQNWVEAIDWW